MITIEATKNERQPKYSAISPENVRANRMPMTKPLMTVPMA
ncbi:hypothetical protein [Nitrosospira sp. NRS527]|nr:hypothetical protein [Nitrosospira sp. NRS527]